MIIKMVNELKLTVVHFARPNPMQICACVYVMNVIVPPKAINMAAENSVNIGNLLWLTRPLIIWTDQANISISPLLKLKLPKRLKILR